MNGYFKISAAAFLTAVCLLSFAGCVSGGYSNSWIYPKDVQSVYVEMFDTTNFRRGHEYELTEAICKRIEAQTPYKIVSSRDRADTILSGAITPGEAVLAGERYTGYPLEKEAIATVTFSWKNLKNGQFMIQNETVRASAPFSEFLDQNYELSMRQAVNKAAQRVVERMEISW